MVKFLSYQLLRYIWWLSNIWVRCKVACVARSRQRLVLMFHLSLFQKGDVLLSVNGQSLLGLTHGQAVAQLKATAELAGVTLSLLDGPETSSSTTANFVPSWLYWQKLPRPLQISRSVVLQRSPGSSLGFSIVGGTDPSRGSEPIHVLLVVASSPAAIDGKLRCGDRILAVDNYSLENVSHSTAVGLLKQAGQRVHLEVVSWLGTELWCWQVS